MARPPATFRRPCSGETNRKAPVVGNGTELAGMSVDEFDGVFSFRMKSPGTTRDRDTDAGPIRSVVRRRSGPDRTTRASTHRSAVPEDTRRNRRTTGTRGRRTGVDLHTGPPSPVNGMRCHSPVVAGPPGRPPGDTGGGAGRPGPHRYALSWSSLS